MSSLTRRCSSRKYLHSFIERGYKQHDARQDKRHVLRGNTHRNIFRQERQKRRRQKTLLLSKFSLLLPFNVARVVLNMLANEYIEAEGALMKHPPERLTVKSLRRVDLHKGFDDTFCWRLVRPIPGPRLPLHVRMLILVYEVELRRRNPELKGWKEIACAIAIARHSQSVTRESIGRRNSCYALSAKLKKGITYYRTNLQGHLKVRHEAEGTQHQQEG